MSACTLQYLHGYSIEGRHNDITTMICKIPTGPHAYKILDLWGYPFIVT